MGYDRHDLELLFPTTFSAPCVQAGRAIAQMAEACRIKLTIVHVAKPGTRSLRLRHQLESFLGGSDTFVAARRLLLEDSDPARLVGELCERTHYDLIVSPSVDRWELRNVLKGSFRAQVLKQCAVPLWTAGSCLGASNFTHPIRTVACLIDFDRDAEAFLRLVSAFALRIRARIRVLSVVPRIDDGVLFEASTSDSPLMPDLALSRIQAMFAGQEFPAIDVAVGERNRGLRRMLARGDADLLFVPRPSAHDGWSFRLSRDLDRLPCPVVCLDASGTGFKGWSFQDKSRRLYGEPLAEPVLVAS